MITYHATTPHTYTFDLLCDLWQPGLKRSSRTVGYSQLELAHPPAQGLHLLTDFERLRPKELALVSRIRAGLQRPGIAVLGNPDTWLDRHGLLTRLHHEGINDFRAYTVDEISNQIQYPVFLRWADRHSGTIGTPVRSRDGLDRRIGRLTDRVGGARVRAHLLIIEKVDARGADRLFRKYSIAKIGPHLIPRHIEFSRNWVTKQPDVVNRRTVAEEQEFLANPRDVELIGEVFDLLGVEFGRIDWGYVGGRPQVWEINTNPMLSPSRIPHPLRRRSQRIQTRLVREALQSLVPAPAPAGSSALRDPLIGAPQRWWWSGVQRKSAVWDRGRR